MPMRDRRAERAGRRSHLIDMNPLVIAGYRGELIDARLVYALPVAGSEGRPDEGLQLS
jgi:hypothetical protein